MSNINIHPFPEQLPQKIIDRALRLNPALLGDGMLGTDIPMQGCMDAGILPVDAKMKFAGTAMTIDTRDGDNFPIHVASYAAPRGYVMVIDGKAYPDRAYLGDLIVGAARAAGFLGIVVDGYVRDREGITEMGIPGKVLNSKKRSLPHRIVTVLS